MWSKSEEYVEMEPQRGDEVAYIPWSDSIPPREQTVEQWLEDYDNANTTTQLQGKSPEKKEMHFKETGGGIDFEPAPMGMRIARCIRIIDLGTTFDTMYQKDKHNVFFMWELPNDMKQYTNKENQQVTEPFTVGKYYNMSLSEGANLRSDLESWRSRGFTAEELKGFDPRSIIGAPCMLNIVHKPKKPPKTGVNAIITAVTPLVQGIDCPAQVHPSVYFSLEAFDQGVLDSLSSGMKGQIMQSHEFAAMQGQQAVPPAHADPSMQPAMQQQQSQMQQPAQQPTARIDDGFDDIPF